MKYLNYLLITPYALLPLAKCLEFCNNSFKNRLINLIKIGNIALITCGIRNCVFF